MVKVEIEIVFAPNPDLQWLESIEIKQGCTVEQAINASGALAAFPEINLTYNKVGIYGKLVSLSHCLQSKARIEIYRPLKIDPKTARRLRALKRGAKAAGNMHQSIIREV